MFIQQTRINTRNFAARRGNRIDPQASPSFKAGRGRRTKARRGAAAVEAALMLPVMFVLVFGSIELANGIFLRQSLTVAAYEGARSATKPGGTSETARQRIRDVLASRGVEDETVTVSPEVTGATARGTKVTVTVSVDGAAHAMSPLRLLDNRTVEKYVVMVRL